VGAAERSTGRAGAEADGAGRGTAVTVADGVTKRSVCTCSLSNTRAGSGRCRGTLFARSTFPGGGCEASRGGSWVGGGFPGFSFTGVEIR